MSWIMDGLRERLGRRNSEKREQLEQERRRMEYEAALRWAD